MIDHDIQYPEIFFIYIAFIYNIINQVSDGISSMQMCVFSKTRLCSGNIKLLKDTKMHIYPVNDTYFT